MWRKLGLVFCPKSEAPWMVSHAAVPFAEPLGGDIFRVYFSSRDSRNRSNVGYVDVDLNNPHRILNLSSEPVVAPGCVGYFDDSGAMLSWITPTPEGRYLYYIGWNLAKTVPFRNSIGLAIDAGDGFKKFSSGPIIDRSPFDPCFVASCCVIREPPVWRMWYLSCIGWESRNTGMRHRYHIKYAESFDGVNWQRHGRICINFASSSEYAISRPSVLKENDRYLMWYSYRGEAYRIGYAESDDGLTWYRLDHRIGLDVSASGWDSLMIEYPHVFVHRGNRFMLYNGNDYGGTGFGLAIEE